MAYGSSVNKTGGFSFFVPRKPRTKVFQVPDENEFLTVAKMGEVIRNRVEARLRLGAGAHGLLPRPKDGGTAMNRTGRILSNIYYVMRTSAKGTPRAIVRADGKRPVEETADKKPRAAARQRAARRAAASTGYHEGKRLAVKKYKSSGRRRGPASLFRYRFNTSSIRIRSADTNSSVVAILSLPPSSKDKRGRAGGRGVYIVFDTNTSDQQAIQGVVKSYLKPTIDLAGTG